MGREKISAEQALNEYGIIANHEKMENGELRFRLVGNDGNGYIRTVMGIEGAWQNSHYHKQIAETYIVESGWIAMASDQHPSGFMLVRLGPGDSYTTTPLERHNVFMSAGTVIHTVKHRSVVGEADWHAAPEFDSKCKHLVTDEVLAHSLKP